MISRLQDLDGGTWRRWMIFDGGRGVKRGMRWVGERGGGRRRKFQKTGDRQARNEGRKRAHKPVTSQACQHQHGTRYTSIDTTTRLHLARSVLSAEMAGGGTRDGSHRLVSEVAERLGISYPILGPNAT